MYTSANHGFLIRDAEEDGVGDEQTLNGRLKLNDAPPELVLVFDDSTPETTIDSGLPPRATAPRRDLHLLVRPTTTRRFECSLDGAAFAACTSPHRGRGPERRRPHGSRCGRRARSERRPDAGRLTSWTVDAIAAARRASPGPAVAERQRERELRPSRPDDRTPTFECALNEGDFERLHLAAPSYDDLGDGRTRVPRPGDRRARQRRIRARPRTPGRRRRRRRRRSTPARPTRATAAPPPSRSAAATTHRAARLVFECTLDEGDWADLRQPARATTGLGDGRHSFRCAPPTRPATPSEPASHGGRSTPSRPQTTIDAGPADPSNESAARASSSAPSPAPASSARWTRATGRPARARTSTRRWPTAATPCRCAPPTRPATGRARPATAGRSTRSRPTTTIDAGAGRSQQRRLAELRVQRRGRRELPVRASTRATGRPARARRATRAWATAATASGARHRRGRQPGRARQPHAGRSTPSRRQTSIDVRPGRSQQRASRRASSSAPRPAPSFECALDEGDWAACASPPAVRGRWPTAATPSQVRATDAAGNTGAARPPRLDGRHGRAARRRSSSGAGRPQQRHLGQLRLLRRRGCPSFECALDEGAFASLRVTRPPTRRWPTAAHSFQVRASDAAGNQGASPAAYAWTIDTVAPADDDRVRPARPHQQHRGQLRVHRRRGCRLRVRARRGRLRQPAASRPTTRRWATAGTPSRCAPRDAAGNQARPAAYSWTIDTDAPETTIESGPADPSNDTSASFAFSADEAGELPSARSTRATGPPARARTATRAWPTAAHASQVRATDAAGNAGQPGRLQLDGRHGRARDDDRLRAGRPTNSSRGQLRLRCRRGGAASSARWTRPPSRPAPARRLRGAGRRRAQLPGARHRRGRQPGAARPPTAGRSTPSRRRRRSSPGPPTPPTTPRPASTSPPTRLPASSARWTRAPREPAARRPSTRRWPTARTASRCAPPTRPATRAPAGRLRLDDRHGRAGDDDRVRARRPINEHARASFDFSADEAAELPVRARRGRLGGLREPARRYEGAGRRAAHASQVRATDAAGNHRPARPPTAGRSTRSRRETTIESGPGRPAPTQHGRASLLGRRGGAGFECALDEAAFASLRLAGQRTRRWPTAAQLRRCAPPTRPATSAEPGRPTPGRSTRSRRRRRSTPARADPATTPRRASRSPPEAGASFECALDEGDWATPATARSLRGAWPTGRTRFAGARQRRGRQHAARPSPQLDDRHASAPETTIDSGPRDPTNAARAPASTSPPSEAARLRSARSTRPPSPSCSSPQDYNALADGPHSFQVRATDAAGNTRPRRRATPGQIDATRRRRRRRSPSGPHGPTNNTTASFTFSGSDDESDRLPASSAGWTQAPTLRCVLASPTTYRGLAEGTHTLRGARHRRGRQRRRDAAASYTGRSTRRHRRRRSTPARRRSRTSTTPTFTFSGARPAPSFQCRSTAAPSPPAPRRARQPALADGAHTFEVRATDAAGNTDARPPAAPGRSTRRRRRRRSTPARPG